METSVPTTFFYTNATVCPNISDTDCSANQALAKTYQSLSDSLSAQTRKLDDIKSIYGRELAYTFNMILGCIGLGLYIKYNQ